MVDGGGGSRQWRAGLNLLGHPLWSPMGSQRTLTPCTFQFFPMLMFSFLPFDWCGPWAAVVFSPSYSECWWVGCSYFMIWRKPAYTPITCFSVTSPNLSLKVLVPGVWCGLTLAGTDSMGGLCRMDAQDSSVYHQCEDDDYASCDSHESRRP